MCKRLWYRFKYHESTRLNSLHLSVFNIRLARHTNDLFRIDMFKTNFFDGHIPPHVITYTEHKPLHKSEVECMIKNGTPSCEKYEKEQLCWISLLKLYSNYFLDCSSKDVKRTLIDFNTFNININCGTHTLYLCSCFFLSYLYDLLQ